MSRDRSFMVTETLAIREDGTLLMIGSPGDDPTDEEVLEAISLRHSWLLDEARGLAAATARWRKRL